jgi:hypothetical protein
MDLDGMMGAKVGQMGQGSQLLWAGRYGEACRDLGAILDAGTVAEWNLHVGPLESSGNHCSNGCSHPRSHRKCPVAASLYCNMAALLDAWSSVVSHLEMDNNCHEAQRS